jgi:hypothetical protein
MLMSLPSYYAYLARQVDEEPLYVFDATFGESAPQLLQAYSVPACFTQDYYSALGARRPDHRWLVSGPGELGAGAAWCRPVVPGACHKEGVLCHDCEHVQPT